MAGFFKYFFNLIIELITHESHFHTKVSCTQRTRQKLIALGSGHTPAGFSDSNTRIQVGVFQVSATHVDHQVYSSME